MKLNNGKEHTKSFFQHSNKKCIGILVALWAVFCIFVFIVHSTMINRVRKNWKPLTDNFFFYIHYRVNVVKVKSGSFYTQSHISGIYLVIYRIWSTYWRFCSHGSMSCSDWLSIKAKKVCTILELRNQCIFYSFPCTSLTLYHTTQLS